MNTVMRATRRFLLVAMLAGPGIAQAGDVASGPGAFGDLAGRYYISGLYSHTQADSQRQTGNASGALLALGKPMNDYATLELFGSTNRYQAQGAARSSGRLQTLGLAVTGFPFAKSEDGIGHWLSGAYGVIGASYAKGKDLPQRAQRYDQNKDGYAFDLGLGYLARIPFTRLASLRVDARYRMNFVTSPFASVEIDDEANSRPNVNDVVLSVGLLVPIGRLPPPPPPPPAPQVVAPESPPPPPGTSPAASQSDACAPAQAGADSTADASCPAPLP